MSKSISQDFDDEIFAMMRLRENKAFLRLEMKEEEKKDTVQFIKSFIEFQYFYATVRLRKNHVFLCLQIKKIKIETIQL